MSNKVKEIDIKNRSCNFFNGIIVMKIFDSYKIKINEKSYSNLLNWICDDQRFKIGKN